MKATDDEDVDALIALLTADSFDDTALGTVLSAYIAGLISDAHYGEFADELALSVFKKNLQQALAAAEEYKHLKSAAKA